MGLSSLWPAAIAGGLMSGIGTGASAIAQDTMKRDELARQAAATYEQARHNRAMESQAAAQNIVTPDADMQGPLAKMGINLTGPTPVPVFNALLAHAAKTQEYERGQAAAQQAGTELMRQATTEEPKSLAQWGTPGTGQAVGRMQADVAAGGAPAPTDLSAASPTNTVVDPQRAALAKMLPMLFQQPQVAAEVRQLFEPKVIPPGSSILQGGKFTQPPPPSGAGGAPQVQDLGGGVKIVTTIDPKTGLPTQHPMQEQNFNPGQITDDNAMATLVREGKLRPDASITNMTTPERALVVDRKVALQASAAGQKAANVTINQNQAGLQAPAKTAELEGLWIPSRGDFAANIPELQGKSRMQLVQQYGAVSAKTRGGADKILATEHGAQSALGHINEIRAALTDAYNAGLIPKSGMAEGYLQSWRRSIEGDTNPFLTRLQALNRGDLQILAGMAPPTGNRFGYQLLNYINNANPAEFKQPFTYDSGLAALDAWEKVVKIKQQTQGVNALDRKPGQAPPMAPTTTTPGATEEWVRDASGRLVPKR